LDFEESFGLEDFDFLFPSTPKRRGGLRSLRGLDLEEGLDAEDFDCRLLAMRLTP
jgi:hypothetical protein